MSKPKVDIHPHIVSPDTARYPLDPLGGKRSNWSADAHSNTAEELLQAMNDCGIAKAALVHSSTTYGYDNSLVLDAVAANPDRFAAVCSIDMMAPDAVDRLTEIIAQGCCGIRLFTAGSTMTGQADWLNDPKTFPVWKYCEEISFPICVQANPSGMGMLRDVMDRHPGVPVLIDHIGRPNLSSGPPYADADQVLEIGRKYPQTYVKFTPSAWDNVHQGRASPETFMPLLVQAFGARRIAWGSNFPASKGTLADLVAKIEGVFDFMSEDDLAEVMGGTAMRIYPVLTC